MFAETGGLGAKILDDGGRILLMSRAISAVSNKLRLYGMSEQTSDFLERLIAAAKEFKSACIKPSILASASEAAVSPLKEKLSDLSLIIGAYDALFSRDKADPDDNLGRLCEAIGGIHHIQTGHIYFDGFTDFTEQELRVIEALLKMDGNMTVCLTCDGLNESEEIFEPARRTALKLLRMASSNGVTTDIVTLEAGSTGKSGALDFLEKNLFLYSSENYTGDGSAIEIFKAATADGECEYAASKVLEFLRHGYRLHDIAVAV